MHIVGVYPYPQAVRHSNDFAGINSNLLRSNRRDREREQDRSGS
jgi:hypothetical protein